MLRPAFDEDTAEKPLDPSIEKVRRKLVRFVAINGLLIAALMVVMVAIVYKSRIPAAPAPSGAVPYGETAEGTIPLPPGGRLISQSLSGDRLSLDVLLADGSHAILLYDLTHRRMVGRFTVTP